MIENLLEQAPLVSVVIPTYTNVNYNFEEMTFEVEVEMADFINANKDKIMEYLEMREAEIKLPRCLAGFLEQPYVPIEIIVVDDGTPITDYNRVEYICNIINDKRVGPNQSLRYIRKANGGQSSAFNLGIEEANGDYILPFNDDDYICESFISNAVYFLENCKKDIGYVYGEYMYTYDWKEFKRALPPPEPWDVKKLKEGQICPVIGLYRADIAKQVKWDEELPHEEDWDYLLRVSKLTKGHFLQDVFSFVISKHLFSKSVFDDMGVEDCHEMIQRRILQGYYD